jgi:CheY-like chemotaxis protein
VEIDAEYCRTHPDVQPGRYVELAVSDTGSGMSAEVAARAFAPFFTTKRSGEGTGLGLATIYGIVKQSRGSIWVYSEPGLGSTFKIYLPVTTELPAEPGPLESEPTTLDGTETVLLVEDQAHARAVIRDTLRRRGYAVIEATGGSDAIEKSAGYEGAIHALLTDVVMPGMSGRQLAEHLHAARPDLRVVYMSGYTDDAIVHHGILETGLAFVQKPFTADTLLRKLREVLDAREPPAP